MTKEIDNEATIKLVRYALAVLELDTPGKRDLFEVECRKYDINSDLFLTDVGAVVRNYNLTLGEKAPRGFLKD